MDINDLIGIDFWPTEDVSQDDISFGAKAPWEYSPSLNYMEDWDHDGIPNYADHWFGPGAESPVSFGALADTNLDYNEIDDTHYDAGLNDAADSGDYDGNNIGIQIDENPYFDDQYHDMDIAEILFDQANVKDITFGDPVRDAEYWHIQDGENSCAIVAQQGILNSFGIPINEDQAVDICENAGWFDETGTKPDAVGKLLETAGIQTIREEECDITDLAEWLAKGEKVMVGLNSDDLWYPQRDLNGVPVDHPGAEGHLVWITGIEKQRDNTFVIMNDSGIPNGAGKTVLWADFQNAWDDYSNFAVHTRSGGEAFA